MQLACADAGSVCVWNPLNFYSSDSLVTLLLEEGCDPEAGIAVVAVVVAAAAAVVVVAVVELVPAVAAAVVSGSDVDSS